jgi:hypothetical protein
VKLAGFLIVLLVVPAFTQSSTRSSNQYGTRISQVQTAYLLDIPSPVGTFSVTGAARFGDPPGAPQPAAATPAAVTPKAEFETWVEQRSRDYAESVITGLTDIERAAGKATIHRFVRDNFRHTYLTYTMTFETIARTKTFRITFNDSVVESASDPVNHPANEDWKRASAAPYPVPQILRDGETIALTLAMDTRTGRRMVDYIRVGTGPLSPRQGVARDVYAEDAELTITQPRLRTNGIEQPAAASLPATLSAPAVWVYIPGQGRYELSFKPRAGEGFEKAGEVAENSLVFSSDGNIFRIDCAERVATGSGTYNIYAKKDSASDPPDERFTLGIVDPR